MNLEPEECRLRFADARVARMATTAGDSPHLIPIVFAMVADRIVTSVDHKPKRSRNLKRLDNIAANPRVSVLADFYDEDWNKLWWVRADGLAAIVSDPQLMGPALDLLVERYEQYRTHRPRGPIVEVRVTRWTGWSAGAPTGDLCGVPPP